MLKHSKELEAAVLGACLLDKSAFGRTYGLISEEKFYQQDNQHVYATMREMYNLSIPIDLITVYLKMEETGIKLHAGNIPWYLTTLTNTVVDTQNLEYHCFLLKEMWQRRELERLTMSGIDLHEDVRQQGYSINEQINKILDSGRRKEWHSMDELMYNLMIHQQKIKDGKVEFITTGFKAIDRINGGFSGGQMIVVGARPSVGKSALMAKIATSIAERKKTVGIISLEMNNNEIAARLASLETDIEFWRIYRNLFTDENQHKSFYDKVSRQSIHLPIYISDKTKVDVNEIRSKATKLKHKHGLDILMIDYLQLVESAENRNYNREQEVAKISRGVKLLAMELDIPVIILCQLNRAVTARKGKDRFPQLSDLRESGAIEQDADVVMMLHRDWMSGFELHPETGNSTELDADLLGVKWRNGGLFHLELDFEPKKMKFSEKNQLPAGAWRPIEEHEN